MLLTAFLLATTTLATESLEPPLPPEVVPLSEAGRYEVRRTWDDTLGFYEYWFRTHGGGRWRNVVNLPHIKAKHIQSTRSKTTWQGINIYEHKGRVRLFIVPRTPDPAQKRPRQS